MEKFEPDIFTTMNKSDPCTVHTPVCRQAFSADLQVPRPVASPRSCPALPGTWCSAHDGSLPPLPGGLASAIGTRPGRAFRFSPGPGAEAPDNGRAAFILTRRPQGPRRQRPRAAAQPGVHGRLGGQSPGLLTPSTPPGSAPLCRVLPPRVPWASLQGCNEVSWGGLFHCLVSYGARSNEKVPM